MCCYLLQRHEGMLYYQILEKHPTGDLAKNDSTESPGPANMVLEIQTCWFR
jgi:hypothetical protein